MKKSKKVLIIIASVIIVPIFFYNFIMVRNTFDQMYYTRIRYVDDLWFTGGRPTLFDNMDELKNISRDTERFSTQEGSFHEEYAEEYLQDNRLLNIWIYREKKLVTFAYCIVFDETDVIPNKEYVMLEYVYNVKTKELIRNPIRLLSERYKSEEEDRYNTNKEDITEFLESRDMTWEEVEELEEWFFYDKFLVDWFDANNIYTRFSINHLGKYTYIEEENE